MPITICLTHVEDVKDPEEVKPPSGDRIFIALRVEKSRGDTPFPLLDNVFLDL